MALTRITKGVIKPNENYDTHDINSTGIITATGLNVSGNASIGGVLTYEDVTNIDSIGIITARSDIKVGTGVTLTSAGAGFYAGIVTASNFVKRDGSSVGGFTPTINGVTRGGTSSGNAGSNNTFFGLQAGQNATSTTQRCTAVGAEAFKLGSNYASNVTAMGWYALQQSTGNNNTGVGLAAFQFTTSGKGNTGLGKNCGRFITIGDYNTVIGCDVAQNATEGDNNTLIGYAAEPSSATVSNEITLGDTNINHLRIPGIGVSFSTNGNHISGITTFSDRIKLGNSGQGELYYSGGIKMVSTAQIELESANQMYFKNTSSGFHFIGAGQQVLSMYGGSGGGVYFRHNNNSKLKLEGGNWTYQGSPTVTFDGNILASSDSAIDIGTNSVRFANIYADTLYGDGSNLTNVSASFTTDAQFNLVAGEDAGSNFSGTSAEKNILLGHDAGKRITTGDNNIAIGDEALAASDGGNITGSGNIAIGRQAMKQKAVTGDGNVIIGDNRAGRLISSGSHNIGLGMYALHYVDSGSANIALGQQALDYVGSGSGNIGIGQGALTELAGSNSNNTAIGYYAGSGLDAGSNNIIIGNNAAASATTISNEITLGDTNITKFRIPGINFILKDNGGTPTQGHVLTVDANGEASFAAASGGGGSVSSDSAENTVGGSDAGLNLNTSSSYRNTLFGYQAGEQINSGDDNTCIGWKAMDKLTSGSYNVAVGSEALENNSSGSDNVAIGWEAGRSLTSGQGNTMIGHMAGRTMSGNENIAIGDHAYSNGGGTRTIGIGGESVWLGGTDVIGIGKFTMSRGNSQVGGIGIGYYAGRNNAGDHNVYIGYEAGKGTSSSPYSTGEYNISLGYRSLYNITTGNKNIALGSEAGDVLTTGSNNIIIGDSADASSATVSNEITIGDANITKFRIPGLNSFEISDAGVLSGTASAATSANGFRNVTVSTASPSGGSDGDVWIKYS